MRCLLLASLLTVLCWHGTSAQGVNLPTATNIRWSSINFKTILEWDPKPTNYTYTVLIRSPLFQNWKKKCIYTMDTSCDVSDILRDTRNTYEVRILSEVKSEDSVEDFPYTEGPTFNPYEQTTIGKPVIQDFMFNKDHSKLTVVVKATPTPYRSSNSSVTVQDIFQNDFTYTVFYNKVSSTRKKPQSSATNEIVINTEQGESYCFYVQTEVPSRKQGRFSQKSDELCTSSDGGDFDITILVAVGIAVALIVLIIVLSVILCKCRNGKKEKSKETMPLNDV